VYRNSRGRVFKRKSLCIIYSLTRSHFKIPLNDKITHLGEIFHVYSNRTRALSIYVYIIYYCGCRSCIYLYQCLIILRERAFKSPTLRRSNRANRVRYIIINYNACTLCSIMCVCVYRNISYVLRYVCVCVNFFFLITSFIFLYECLLHGLTRHDASSITNCDYYTTVLSILYIIVSFSDLSRHKIIIY